MNGFISIGTVTISISTAYKTAVLALLGSIAAGIGYVVYWLST